MMQRIGWPHPAEDDFFPFIIHGLDDYDSEDYYLDGAHDNMKDSEIKKR